MNLITDRTLSDVLLGNSKGIYSYTDLNRVEQAVLLLAQMAEKLDLWFTPRVLIWIPTTWPPTSSSWAKAGADRQLMIIRDHSAVSIVFFMLSLPRVLSDKTFCLFSIRNSYCRMIQYVRRVNKLKAEMNVKAASILLSIAALSFREGQHQ